MRMTLADVSFDRSVPGQAVGLFLTDRCPVGCAHCSVDSRPDSPTVTDFVLLEQTVRALARRPALRSVGITGGEPFTERRALTFVVDELAGAGKGIALFTSGVWARGRRVPTWIRDVLRKTSCVFLSTDAYHAKSVGGEEFTRAIRTITDEGVWLIVQVLKSDLGLATELLDKALGAAWNESAEISPVPPLPYGRGASLFTYEGSWAGSRFGRCSLASTPLIRYDGTVTACCNEEVIMGGGAQRLRRRCATVSEITETVDRYISDPLLLGLSKAGAAALTAHPRYAHLSDVPFSSICHLCWAMQDVTPETEDDPILIAAANLGLVEAER